MCTALFGLIILFRFLGRLCCVVFWTKYISHAYHFFSGLSVPFSSASNRGINASNSKISSALNISFALMPLRFCTRACSFALIHQPGSLGSRLNLWFAVHCRYVVYEHRTGVPQCVNSILLQIIAGRQHRLRDTCYDRGWQSIILVVSVRNGPQELRTVLVPRWAFCHASPYLQRHLEWQASLQTGLNATGLSDGWRLVKLRWLPANKERPANADTPNSGRNRYAN